MQHTAFFTVARDSLFAGSLAQSQVDGLNAILAEGDRRALDKRWLAYILATAYHETGPRSREGHMQPVREAYWLSEDWRRKNLRYFPFYGRGFVQLTWEANYKAMGELLGVDLVDQPDLALQLDHATFILFEGMIRGTFTSKKLADYFNTEKTDWVGARRIVNGTDKAAAIADIAQKFHEALRAEPAAAPTSPPKGEITSPPRVEVEPLDDSAATTGDKPRHSAMTFLWFAIAFGVVFLAGRFWKATKAVGLGAWAGAKAIGRGISKIGGK